MNMERANKIILEAIEQSERADTLILDDPVSLEEAINTCETSLPIVLDLNGEKLDVTQFSENKNKKIEVFVGPEGGWGEKDLKLFKEKNCKKIKIGENVLRAETAAVAISSLLLLR
jgi:16S rRNA (uracil1498-N3)-methyltransferase